MKTIFKVGDKVYDFRYGWGQVIETDSTEYIGFPIIVEYNYDKECFTIDGKYNLNDPLPTLSFTKYDFVNGGFSQMRPVPKIERNTLVYVRNEGNLWKIAFFSHFHTNGLPCCFIGQKKSHETIETDCFDEISLTNPLEQ